MSNHVPLSPMAELESHNAKCCVRTFYYHLIETL